MENDNKEPDPECTSSTSSMSFILAEEIDSLVLSQEEPETEVGIDSLAVMTASQYAQVVFHDVADSYPNDTELVCTFTLCLAPDPEVKLQHKPGDKIGVFRVPYIRPEEGLLFVKVTDLDLSASQGCLTFKSSDLPEDEDFFQFQYLRTTDSETRVLGASIPFQLRKPKTEELCAVEQGDSEFMVVQTSTALATGQLSDKIGNLQSEKEHLQTSLTRTTTDYSKLLNLSEDLTEKLELKTVVNIGLEQELQKTKLDLVQLKSDVAVVVQDKVVLEQRLHKSKETEKKLTKEVDDFVAKLQLKEAKVQDKEREIRQLKEHIEKAKGFNEKDKDIRKLKEEVARSHLQIAILDTEQMVKEKEIKQFKEQIEKAKFFNEKEEAKMTCALREELKKSNHKIEQLETEKSESRTALEDKVRENRKLKTTLKLKNEDVRDMELEITRLEARLRLITAKSGRKRVKDESKKLSSQEQEVQKGILAERRFMGEFTWPFTDEVVVDSVDGSKKEIPVPAPSLAPPLAPPIMISMRKRRDAPMTPLMALSMAPPMDPLMDRPRTPPKPLVPLAACMSAPRGPPQAPPKAPTLVPPLAASLSRSLTSPPLTPPPPRLVPPRIVSGGVTNSDKANRLTSLEEKVKELQNYVKEMDQTHTSLIGELNRDVESLKMSTAGGSCRTSLSSEFGAEMMRSDFIGQKLRESEAKDSVCQASGDQKVSASQEIKKQVEAAAIQDEPTLNQEKETSQANAVAASLANQENTLFKAFFPDETEMEPFEMAKKGIESLVTLFTNPQDKETEQTEQLSDADTAVADDLPKLEEIEQTVGVTLSDDGRPIGGEPLVCPICQKEFNAGEVWQLQFHVDEHVRDELVCPVCNITFTKDLQQVYEGHVSGHFDEEDAEANNAAAAESSFIKFSDFGF